MIDAWEALQDGAEPEDCISHNVDDAIDGGGGWHLLLFMFMNAPIVI